MNHWIIEHFSDKNGLQHLGRQLKNLGVSHQFVDLTKGQDFNPTLSPKNPIVFFGSQELGLRLKKISFTPGLFLGNDDFLAQHLMSCPQALNRGTMTTVAQLEQDLPLIFKTHSKGVFVRPNSWEKHFSGQVVTPENFAAAWKNITFYLNDLSLPVIWSELKLIESEYRFHFINGSMVTGSCYASKSEGVSEVEVTPEIDSFLKDILEFFPGSNCTIDLAKTSEGLKLIEFNPLSTSAIYLSNPLKIYEALK